MPGPPVSIGAAVVVTPGATAAPDSGVIVFIPPPFVTAGGMPLATAGPISQMVNSLTGVPYPLVIGPPASTAAPASRDTPPARERRGRPRAARGRRQPEAGAPPAFPDPGGRDGAARALRLRLAPRRADRRAQHRDQPEPRQALRAPGARRRAAGRQGA